MATQLDSQGGRTAFWRDTRVRGVIFQAAVGLALVAFIGFIVHNTATNLDHRGLKTGFGFLGNVAGFDIGITLIPYGMTSSYARAYLVGLVNTLAVAAVGVVFATLWGFLLGVLRLSGNWLMARLAAIYVDIMRNVPLLLQLLFWYFGVFTALPPLRQSLSVGGSFFLNQRGLYGPAPILLPGWQAIPIALVAGIAAAMLIGLWARRRQAATGRQFPIIWTALALVLGLPVLAALAAGLPVEFELPVLKGFNFSGGAVVLPEFLALVLALSLYTAAFIAEIVRAGIMAVSHGQTEAALSLGLRPGLTTRLVVIPQALRVIIPPLTSQYLNITKNSTLAVAIGYPDLVNVFAGTVLNQTGRAIEVISITMLTYGTISLLISLFMNWYNRRVALVER
ncbi:MAG: amino acid ABC transporter permease [Dongiaceae bacterium]